MQRDEKWGISGYGQKSYKRSMYKFHNWFHPGNGGGPQVNPGALVDVEEHSWTGSELKVTKPGGLGVIPVEDQFKTFFTGNKGEVYVSYVFITSPKKSFKQKVVYLEEKDCNGKQQSLQLDLDEKEVFWEYTYENMTIIWTKKKCVVTPLLN